MSEDFLKGITTVKEINEGAYGNIYEICKGKYNKYTDSCEGDLYAEKVYISGDPDFNEIDILSRFDHPNLLKAVKSSVDSKGNFHLILPLADKPNYDLNQVINNKTLSFDKIVLYIYQIISAACFLHSQEYYHCDIKPQNILMFNDNCVLADYGLTYHMSYDTKTYCGTVGYASPQGWQGGRIYFKDWPYYNEKLNQVQGDIYAIGSTFYECLTNKKLVDYNYYYYEHQDKLDSFNEDQFYEYIYDKAYRDVEGKLEEIKNNETNEDYRLAYDCIYNMCRNSQNDRYKTINEVLQHPLFSSRTMTRIIPGKIKATKMPDIDICKSLITPKISFEKIVTTFGESGWLAGMLKMKEYTLLVYTTFYTLLYRTIQLAKRPFDIELVSFSCLFLSISTFRPSNVDYSNYNFKAGYTKYDIKKMVYKIVDELEGVIRIPSIYEETDNALEIIWWLLTVNKDCSYILKSPKELHSIYAEIEANKPSLISSRINKNSVISMTYVSGSYNVSYNIDDETKTTSLSKQDFL